MPSTIQKPVLSVPKWKSLYKNARIKLQIAPKIKEDYYKIMSEAVKDINADKDVKIALLRYYEDSLKKYKSWQSYGPAVMYPAMFIQWLSDRNNKEIFLEDLERPEPRSGKRAGITKSDGTSFARAVSDSENTRATIRSYLMGFGKYLDEERYVTSNPFTGLKVEMPESSGSIIVYNEDELNEYFNSILFGAKQYHILFSRLMLQTGLRPRHMYYITCGDIGNEPVTDALDRTFYPIAARKVLDREKKKIGEEVYKKYPPTFVYISSSLHDDLLKWCRENNLTDKGYLFKDFINLNVTGGFIRTRRNSLNKKGLIKSKKKYILYGLRHTWSAVIFTIGTLKTLTSMGGWTSDKTALDIYAKDMDEQKALKTLKDWEIYIIPELKSKIERIQREIEESVPDAEKVDLRKRMAYLESTIVDMKNQLSLKESSD